MIVSLDELMKVKISQNLKGGKFQVSYDVEKGEIEPIEGLEDHFSEFSQAVIDMRDHELHISQLVESAKSKLEGLGLSIEEIEALFTNQ